MTAHVPETQLALYSRGDLGFWNRFRVRRHLQECDACAEIVSDYSGMEEQFSDMSGLLPPVLNEAAWQRLSAEMTANIRLGMAAGECVSEKRRMPVRPRLAAAFAGCAALAAVVMLEYPRIVPDYSRAAKPISGMRTLEADARGIAVSGDGRMLSVPSPAGRSADVIRTVNTRGDMRSRYVDDTGVTIVDVYADAE